MSTSHRRLVVLLDGTWQGRADGTNVALLDQNIQRGMTGDGIEQRVQYFDGVGTGHFLERIGGGLFGYGLSKSIKDAFLWLSEAYRPNDEVFVFGFSRGAYSARSLVGLMHKCDGVVRQPTKALVDKAYDFYRNANSDSQQQQQFREKHCEKARVRMIGVWDTVGQLGVPVSGLPFVLPGTRAYYRFHNTDLSCIVDRAYHALAIDEYREDFQPTLWGATTGRNCAVEQCWFIGAHSDVGGGTPNSTLSKLAYVWMQERAVAAGLHMSKILTADDQQRQAPSDSFSSFLLGLYRIYKRNQRYIRQLGVHVEEKLHESVVERVKIKPPVYRPKPLTNVGVPRTTMVIRRQRVVKPCSCGNQDGPATS